MPNRPMLSRRALLQDGARRALGAALAATPMTLPAAPAAPRPLDPKPLQSLGRRIDEAIAAGRLPGAVLWVERAGAAPYTGVFGQRALEPTAEPLALDAVFDVASLTKPVVTGVLCAQLLDEGRFELTIPCRATFRATQSSGKTAPPSPSGTCSPTAAACPPCCRWTRCGRGLRPRAR